MSRNMPRDFMGDELDLFTGRDRIPKWVMDLAPKDQSCEIKRVNGQWFIDENPVSEGTGHVNDQ